MSDESDKKPQELKPSENSEKPFKPWRLLRSGLFIYGALVLFAWFGSEFLIFQPHPSGYSDGPGILKVQARDGEQIAVISLPNPKAKYTILYSHGNAEDLQDVQGALNSLRRRGFAVVAYDYPGYGVSTGRPTENGCNNAIDAVYDHIINTMKVPPQQLILYGRSVGGGPTMYLADKREHRALILESTFTSTFRVAIPFPLLPFDRFPNQARLDKYAGPVLIMHGEKDRVVPFSHGKSLFESCQSPLKRSYFVKEAGHNNFRQKAGQGYVITVSDFALSLEAGPSKN
jgi:abhydrolase domain-containing protein 17